MVNTWTTKEGEEIPISSLADSHLLNILAMLRRKAVVAMAAVNAQILTLPAPSAEGAQDAFDAECEAAFSATWIDHAHRFSAWTALVREARARGILDADFLDPAFGIDAEVALMERLGAFEGRA